MKRFAIKNTAWLVLAALGMGQAYAHTGVRDQVVEKQTSYNGFHIGHACASGVEGESAQGYPVIGQSALFPYGDTAVWRDQTGAVIQQGGNGMDTIKDAKLDLKINGYASFSSPFATTQEIVDAAGVVRALQWSNGAVDPKLNAVTPFRATIPEITNPCVKTLKIRVGVINWCDLKKNEENDAKGPYKAPRDAFGRPVLMTTDAAINDGKQLNVAEAKPYKNMGKGNGDNNRADWWFFDLHGGSKLYKDPQIIGGAANYWSAAITVNNSAADNEACVTGGGTLVDYTVEPAGVDFDTILTGPNTQPFTLGDDRF